MGFSNTSTTINLVAKLTPFGRQQLLSNNSKIITHFAIGDSDAYYGAKYPLNTGEIPDLGGNLGLNSNGSNSVVEGYKPRSLVSVDSLGNRKKLVKEGSSNVISEKAFLGNIQLSGNVFTNYIINKNNYEIDSKVNLFYSLRLPITDADETLFTVTPSIKGGFSDTAYSALSTDEILVLGVPADKYGEVLDGKRLKLSFSTGVNTYTLYGTYERTLTKLTTQDANYKETSFNSSRIGNNITFLFSDDIQRPNNDPTKSWSTGYNKSKPFSLGRKELFNPKSDANTGIVQDKIVGIAYLDKGIITIIDPTILSELSGSTTNLSNVSLEYNSLVTKVTQEVSCILDRGEFGISKNPTFIEGDVVRISEVFLLDNNENIIAIAKSDRHIEKRADQFMALGIKITV